MITVVSVCLVCTVHGFTSTCHSIIPVVRITVQDTNTNLADMSSMVPYDRVFNSLQIDAACCVTNWQVTPQSVGLAQLTHGPPTTSLRALLLMHVEWDA